MKRAIGAAFGVALSCMAAALPAQQTDSLSQSYPEFLERHYLFKNVPDDRTAEWFEGLLALHIPLRQNLQAAYDAVLIGDQAAHGTVAWYFSMVTNLRMTKESSAPVRTPSYMPKLTVTYFNVKRRESWTLPDSLPRSVRMWAFPFVPYGHYSNGQDGCLYADQDLANDCAEPITIQSPREANRRDGSFSSHYMQLGAFYRRFALDQSLHMGSRPVARSYWSLGGQVRAYQPYYWLGGGMSEELREVYGPTRVRGLWNSVSQRNGRLFGPGLLRYEAWIEGIFGAAPQVDPVRISLEVARTMDRRSGWGVFARGYHGQDDYNLGFLTNITVLQVGVTQSAERMPAFR